MTTLMQLWQQSEQSIGFVLTSIAALCATSFALSGTWVLWNLVLDARDALYARRARINAARRDQHIRQLGKAWHGGGPNHVA